MKNLAKDIKTGLIDLLEVAFVGITVFASVFYLFIGQSLRVTGLSMIPTFKNDEVIMIEKLTLNLNPLERKTIIVFKSPKEPKKLLIKRVVGLPNETIKISEGIVYINGTKLEEPYINGLKTKQEKYLLEGQEYKIPNGEYVVMGDNRVDSEDSREFGPIKTTDMTGKVLMVYEPIKNFRIIKN